MIAGEYAILEPRHQAIVAAVTRYVHVTVSDSDQHRIHISGSKQGDVTWTYENRQVYVNPSDHPWHFIESAISTVLNYLDDPDDWADPFALAIASELADEQGKKYGLGSSAAVVVGTITALLYRAYGRRTKLSTDLIYKLAIIAHFRVQGNGSGADIAAAVFGGWLCYTAFSSEWLAQRLNAGIPIRTIAHEPWPQFAISHLILPAPMTLRVGWTGHPAATAPLVQKVQASQYDDSDRYDHFLQASSRAVETLLQGFTNEDPARLLTGISQNRQALSQYGQHTGIPIETPLLSTLADTAEKLNGAGKSSGAGGGDCGIAITDQSQADKLAMLWKEKGIEPLLLQVSDNGVTLQSSSVER